MNQKKYTISVGGSIVGPGVWESIEAWVWAAVSAREGLIVGVAGCTSFAACGGGRGDGGGRGAGCASFLTWGGGKEGGMGCASFLVWGSGGGARCVEELSMRVEILS